MPTLTPAKAATELRAVAARLKQLEQAFGTKSPLVRCVAIHLASAQADVLGVARGLSTQPRRRGRRGSG